MGIAAKEFHKSVDEALDELEALGDEIRVKLHLAGLDATTMWNERLEPQLFQARAHAREAKEASRAVIHDTLKAFKDFAAGL
jgi:hypothetical protein